MHPPSQQQRHGSYDDACNNSSVETTTTNNNSAGGSGTTLRRSLTALDLILYGVGSSVGAGIYVLVGLGAQMAGPAIGLSFATCGVACILTSLCYADFASRFPVTGSAFLYSYVAFGEGLAWIVGWNLTLGYGFTTSVVARAWADYVSHVLWEAANSAQWIQRSPWIGKLIQYASALPLFEWSSSAHDPQGDSSTDAPERTFYTCSPLSVLLVILGTLVLLRGAKDSSTFNNFMTVLNVGVLLLVILAGSGSVHVDNWTPFFPTGLSGVVAGAGLVFFAFIGFDMVASLSEEVIHPERNMPIGIVGSLVASTFLYVLVSLTVVGMAPIGLLGQTVPIINALLVNACCTHEEQLAQNAINACLLSCPSYSVHPWLATVGRLVGFGAILGLTASCFTSLMGQPRILFSLAREGLIPPIFAAVNPQTQVPDASIIITGIITAVLACFAPMEALASLISLGTLLVFTLVNAGVLVLRLRQNSESLLAVAMENSPLFPPQLPTTPTTGLMMMNTRERDDEGMPHLHQQHSSESVPTAALSSLHHPPVLQKHFTSEPLLHQRELESREQPKDSFSTATVGSASSFVRKQQQELLSSSSFSSSYRMIRRRRRQMQQQQRIVIRWIILYSFCSLAAFICLAHFQKVNVLVWIFLGFSAVAAYYIFRVPTSFWSFNPPLKQDSKRANPVTSNEDSPVVHDVFSCPFVPLVPLMGITCNNFMMGSLPLESWALLVGWMVLGMGIYFAYGMNHSILNFQNDDEDNNILSDQQAALPLVSVASHHHLYKDDDSIILDHLQHFETATATTSPSWPASSQSTPLSISTTASPNYASTMTSTNSASRLSPLT